ncbi:hypothetical protein [Nostoc sp. NMS4]|uniref:hypothetical protein n=1 Tax=Nostoc sp. NMS4 TaxID=2815390 RepID=UPI0025DC0D10|nr:hypothetical protein [Nostoc sp. NMS4]MBN3926114.1 hypothetical protein [Nostoc sp. NMS4]
MTTYRLKVIGSSYGGGCFAYPEDDVYADLGNKSHPNFSLVVIETGIACGGYSFKIVDNADGSTIYTSTSPAKNVHLSIVNNDTGGEYTPPTPTDKYDCINGACIKKTVYSTPGIYQSLSECETACGTGCSGKCVSNADWAQIEGLSNQLKNRNCG